MSDGLKARTFRGLFWSLFERAGHQGVQLVVGIILARLLLPEEFGLIGMLTVFLVLSQLFVDSGFAQALIQKENATHVDECSVLYFNIALSVVAAGLLCLAAPWIAAFYAEPLLTPMTRVLSLNLVISAFGLVHTALLTKRIDFHTQMKITMLATIPAAAIAVTMAYRGFGVWSLVAHALSSTLFRTILLWSFSPWRPSLHFSVASLREMFRFGSRLLGSALMNTVFDNMYVVVIGKVFSSADLGFYTRAAEIQRLQIGTVVVSVNRVMFPVIASIHDDDERIKRVMRRSLTSLAFVNFPIMAGLLVIAEPLVTVLLTEKWLPSVPYLQLISIICLLLPLHAVNLNLYLAKGRSDLHFRLNLIKNVLRVIAIGVTYRWGIEAILWGQIVVSILTYVLNSNNAKQMVSYSMFEQIRDISPYLVMAVLMGCGVYALRIATSLNDLTLLALQVGAGIVLYTALTVTFQPSAFREFWKSTLRQ